MSIHTIEPAYHPKNKMSFLIDWLVTLKCNYDCAYCVIGPKGHDNSTKHPSFEKCMLMLEQLYEYTDVMMLQKKSAFKDAIMNIYGGESIYHPRIVDLMIESSRKFEKYSDRWRLKRRMTTNGTATEKNWKLICDHMEGFTMSYHSTGPDKLKTLFKKNIEHLAKIKKEHDIIVLMYPTEQNWKDCTDMLRYCRDNGFNARTRLVDGPLGVYNEKHFSDLAEFMDEQELAELVAETRIDTQSRACCGGRKMCTNGNLKEYQTLVPRNKDAFHGWHCSANQFFIHGNNVTGQYFTNKDCKVKLDGTIGHVATMESMPAYVNEMRDYIVKNNKMPILTCAQRSCYCGACAPKSVHKENLDKILTIYNNDTSSLDTR